MTSAGFVAIFRGCLGLPLVNHQVGLGHTDKLRHRFLDVEILDLVPLLSCLRQMNNIQYISLTMCQVCACSSATYSILNMDAIAAFRQQVRLERRLLACCHRAVMADIGNQVVPATQKQIAQPR